MRYVSQDVQPLSPSASPFGPTLTKWMEPTIEYRLSGIGSCVISDRVDGGIRTKIIALDGEALRAERQRVKMCGESANQRVEGDWAVCLGETFNLFQAQGKRELFFMLLGCPIVNMIECGEMGKVLPDGQVASQELSAWLDFLKGPDSFFTAHPALCASHIEAKLFFPQWSLEDGGKFTEAKRLYAKGENLDRILQLLVESLSLNPISAEKWGFWGGALRLSGHPQESVFAYVQALRYDKSLIWAWKGLRTSCEEAGLSANANGLLWLSKIEWR